MTRTRGLLVLIALMFVVFAAITYGFYHEAADAHNLAVAIQRSRLAVARTNCVAQNHHHDKTIHALIRLDQKAEKHVSPARRKLIENSQTDTILLINALVPRKNCALLASLIHTH